MRCRWSSGSRRKRRAAHAALVAAAVRVDRLQECASRRMSMRSGDAVYSGMTGCSRWLWAVQVCQQVQGRWYR